MPKAHKHTLLLPGKIGGKGLSVLILLGFMVAFSGCQTIEGWFNQRPKEVIPVDKSEDDLLDIDPNTGVQYYIGNELVKEYPLPDGSVSKMVLLPGGEFIMGLNDEDPLGIQPAGNVRIAVNAFWVDQFEVTNAQYRSFLESLPADERQLMMPDSVAWAKEVGVPWSIYFRDEGFANYPVTCVTWEQASRFAEWAGKRLPAESEWEYAARSGVSGRIYPWPGIYSRNPRTGESLANFAPNGDYAVDGFVITSPVGSFQPNNFRLYDMAGNVTEWCSDSYFPSYKILKRTQKQLVTPTYNNNRDPRKMVRGGSWASSEFFVGVGVRDFRFATQASPRVGFRLAMDAENPLLQRRSRQSFMQRTSQMTNPNVFEVESSDQSMREQAVQEGDLEEKEQPTFFENMWNTIKGWFGSGESKNQGGN
jgi:formylglycine-generating enzyme required for sulfatase activity